MTKFWGYHLSLDMGGCDLEAMQSYELVKDFSQSLVKRIDMVAYGEPNIVHFGTDEKAGFTLSQLIETSNICAHFADEPRSIYLDVFSCKEFDIDTVIDCVNEYFKPQRIAQMFRTRDA